MTYPSHKTMKAFRFGDEVANINLGSTLGRLDAKCTALGLTRSDAVRMALMHWLGELGYPVSEKPEELLRQVDATVETLGLSGRSEFCRQAIVSWLVMVDLATTIEGMKLSSQSQQEPQQDSESKSQAQTENSGKEGREAA